VTTWTSDELTKIAAADELLIAPRRPDGTLCPPVPIWVVRLGDDLYVRSYGGHGGSWFRGALARHEGHIQAGGVDKDVTFAEETDSAVNDLIDAAYRAKYRRFSRTYVDPMMAPDARDATLKLLPR
jgi:hypothetical protein